MKIGVVSDIHANHTALEAVLADMPDVDMLVSLGDVIGYGPHPQQTAKTIRDVADVSLRGNHEQYLENPSQCQGNTGAYEGIQHANAELSDDLHSWLTNTPMRDVIDDTLGIVHGYPDEETPYRYIKPNNVTNLIPTLSDADYTILAAGHSHIQFKQDLRKFDSVGDDTSGIVFNPGSVGQPRDKDPRAGYAVVDTDAVTVDLHRVEYDISNVVTEIQTADLPPENGQRLKLGQMPQRQPFRR